MSVRARVAAWWAAWRFVVVLAAALALSLYGNYVQWRRAITAPLRQENAELREWVDEMRQLADERAREAVGLFAALESIAERGQRYRIVYRNIVEKLPPMPAECAPGAQRVDAVNQFLGPQPTAPREQQ